MILSGLSSHSFAGRELCITLFLSVLRTLTVLPGGACLENAGRQSPPASVPHVHTCTPVKSALKLVAVACGAKRAQHKPEACLPLPPVDPGIFPVREHGSQPGGWGIPYP